MNIRIYSFSCPNVLLKKNRTVGCYILHLFKLSARMESIVDVRSLHIDRLLFFYSEQNVDDVDTIKFWEGQIINYCLKNRTVVFTVEALTQVFIVDDVYPSSLEPVIHNLKTKHKSITECVEVSNEMDTLMSLFSTVSLWALDGKAKASVKYMSIDLLEMIEIQLMSYVSSIGEQNSCVFVAQGNKVPSELTFMGLVRAAGTTSPKKNQLSDYLSSINEDDATLILRNMVQSKRAVLSGDGTMVKIQPARRATPQTSLLGGVLSMWSTATSTNNSTKGFSEAEEAYLRLRSSIRQIEARIEALREGAAAELNKAKLCKVQYVLSTVEYQYRYIVA